LPYSYNIFFIITSYVIHNFYTNFNLITITPKFKHLITSYSFLHFIAWFQLNWLTKKKLKHVMIGKDWKSEFDHLFSKNIFKYFYRNLFFLKTTYTSLYYQSLLTHNLTMFNDFLTKSKVASGVVQIESDLLFNHYFLPIKIITFNVNKKFYEKIFFTFMFMDTNLWTLASIDFKIYLNFFLIDFKLQQFYFFNGFFCNVYNL